MADAIKANQDVASELIEGAGGIFDVSVDGKLIYSKFETGRFPEDHEILEQLAALAKQPTSPAPAGRERGLTP